MGLSGQLKDGWTARAWRFAAWRNSVEATFVFSVDGLEIRDANPEAEALVGASVDELRGAPMSRVLDPACLRRVREAVADSPVRAVMPGHAVLASPSGAARTFEVALAPAAADGLCLCRLSPVAAVQTDGDLRRLNWALAAHARSSAALIHSSSFEELVAGVCEAIVGEDDYLAATVALVEHGPGLPLRLVAAAGRAADYVDGLSLSWSEEAAGGRGPAGIAVRANQAFIMQDALKEPAFDPWRETALRFGIRSSVIVPFGRDGAPSGVLIVYAAEPDTFGERELDVFSRLSGEIAFALALECERVQLREAEEARRAAEEAAQESLAELARAARLISVATFASSLAHEVNQPVAAIAANSEAALRWLSKDPPNLEEARAALQRITRDAARTSAVVGRTRGMLTKDLGRRQAVDLKPLIDEALLFVGLQRKRGSIKVETDYAADLPPVWADPVQIQQVALNLINNAVDAMKGVSARKRVLKITAARSGPDAVAVSVADTGAGVDDDNVEQIFTQLFTTKPGGMGLGLPISKAIVEAHGGRLEMSPNEPFGAVFRFTLPMMEV